MGKFLSNCGCFNFPTLSNEGKLKLGILCFEKNLQGSCELANILLENKLTSRWIGSFQDTLSVPKK